MNDWLTLCALMGHALTCGQLLCYRRGGANYCLRTSLVAWLLIVFTGASALDILLGRSHITLGQAGIAVTLCVLVYRAQGNVANMIKEHG